MNVTQRKCLSFCTVVCILGINFVPCAYRRSRRPRHPRNSRSVCRATLPTKDSSQHPPLDHEQAVGDEGLGNLQLSPVASSELRICRARDNCNSLSQYLNLICSNR